MPRYEHFLFAPKPQAGPGAMLCVDVETHTGVEVIDGNRVAVQLVRWHVVLVLPCATGWRIAREAAGVTEDGFWQTLRTAAKRGKRLWVLTTEFRSAASALGLWERLESGEVWIHGSDPRNRVCDTGKLSRVSRSGKLPSLGQGQQVDSSNMREMPADLGKEGQGRQARLPKTPRKSQGVFIVQDPPVIIQLHPGKGCPMVQWVDAANYSVDGQFDAGSDTPKVRQLAEWFRRAASTLASLGTCGWCATSGGQANHLFRSNYLHDAVLSHTNREAAQLEQDALFGGRCEPFVLGRVAYNVHLLDIRSMYPSLCASLAVPIRYCGILHKPEIETLSRTLSTHAVIARVDIETDEGDYPYHAEGNTIFPVGRFTTVLCGPELADAVRTGRLLRVRSMAVYESSPIMASYMRTLYARREVAAADRDGSIESWIKSLLVCLPGKFAARSKVWLDVRDAQHPWSWGEWYRRGEDDTLQRWRCVADNVQREHDEGFANGTVPAITAYVCSAGRIRLLGLARTAERENVIYCDTDAIIANDYGRENLTLAGEIRPGEWGYLQPVESALGCWIGGRKTYSIGGRIRSGGVPGGGRISAAEADALMRQPAPTESMRHNERPAAFRIVPSGRKGERLTDRPRRAGGRVKPPYIDKLESE